MAAPSKKRALALLLALTLSAAIAGSRLASPRLVFRDFMVGGAVVDYLYKPLGGQEISVALSLTGLQSIGVDKTITLSIYGWAPSGDIVELGNYTIKTRGPLAVVRLDKNKVISYLNKWRSWLKSKGAKPGSAEPPIIILGAITVKNSGVYTFTKSATINPERVVDKGESVTIKLSYNMPRKPTITWNEMLSLISRKATAIIQQTRGETVKQQQSFPPDVIIVNSYAQWVLEDYTVYYDLKLPQATVYLHGPDKQVINAIFDHWLIISDSSQDLEVVFSIGGVKYKLAPGGVDVLGYTIPGPSFELTETRAWLEVTVEASVTDNLPKLDTGCKQARWGAYCIEKESGSYHYYAYIDHGMIGVSPISVPLNSSVDHLVSIGFEGVAVLAKYRLYLKSCLLGTGYCWWTPTDGYMNTTMVRPYLVNPIDGSGPYVASWVEVDPEPFNNSVAVDSFNNIALNWQKVDYGHLPGSLSISAFEYTRDIGSISILSASVGLPFKEKGLNPNLLGAPVGLIMRRTLLPSLITVNVFVESPHEYDDNCEIWPWLYRSTVLFDHNGGMYPLGAMYVDLYVEDSNFLCNK